MSICENTPVLSHSTQNGMSKLRTVSGCVSTFFFQLCQVWVLKIDEKRATKKAATSGVIFLKTTTCSGIKKKKIE